MIYYHSDRSKLTKSDCYSCFPHHSQAIQLNSTQSDTSQLCSFNARVLLWRYGFVTNIPTSAVNKWWIFSIHTWLKCNYCQRKLSKITDPHPLRVRIYVFDTDRLSKIKSNYSKMQILNLRSNSWKTSNHHSIQGFSWPFQNLDLRLFPLFSKSTSSIALNLTEMNK